MADEPRELTTDEVREQFLDHIRGLVRYWEHEKREPEVRRKLEGLAFSILVMLDGCSHLPGFSVIPSPHPEDKDYHREQGENWYPENGEDIAGQLHDLFYRK